MSAPSALPASPRPSAVWNEAIREFLRSRYGRTLSAGESEEYRRLRKGYTAALKAEDSAAA
ncbi:hypothetical protein [Streptomyces sp. NPDC050738]|uniref:hypothetical protein n=1 Tax=Streptomyces sp. NPDC050738 TaxID=3154744 RepID=UPI003437C827